MIQIICGTCGTSQGYKTKNDGTLTLPAAEERRLVARGVAEYVTKPIIGPDTGVATPAEGKDGGGAGVTPPLQGRKPASSRMVSPRPPTPWILSMAISPSKA